MGTKKGTPTPTTGWKEFSGIIKKLFPIAAYCIKLPSNIIYLKGDGVFSESFAILDNPSLADFYNWAAIDCAKFLSDMKEHDIKIKGTEIIDASDRVIITKNGECRFSVDKLTQTPIEVRYRVAGEFYRKILSYLSAMSDESDWEDIDEASIRKLVDGKSINWVRPSYSVPLTKSAFQNLRDSCMVSIKYLGTGDSDDYEKVYLGIKEVFSGYTLYTLRAIMVF